MKKQLLALLLSATMVCSSGALSLVANAVENDTSVSQSQSNDIEDSRGNIVKIYTTTDCFGEDMVDERTNIRGNAVTMKILTPLKFKVSCSTKYGKLKSVSNISNIFFFSIKSLLFFCNKYSLILSLVLKNSLYFLSITNLGILFSSKNN